MHFNRKLVFTESFSLELSLGATKFLLLSIFSLTATICPEIWSKSYMTQESKKSTYSWRANAQKRRCLNLQLLKDGRKG